MSDQLYVASRKGLFRIDRGRSGWTIAATHFLGDNCSIVLADPRDGTVYAALDHGHFGSKLHRSDDGGTTWQEIASPSYPEPPENHTPKPTAMGKAAPWALKLVWSIEPDSVHEPGGLWCGTIPGGLFHSPDRGESWQLNRPLWDDPRREEWFGGGYDHPGIHSIAVDPRDDAHVVIAVSCGGVWISRDRGASWTLGGAGMRAEYMPPERSDDRVIQDPHRLVTCQRAPDVMWVQHHNGIFRSDDAGANWRELTDIAPSTFGFAVAVHPENPDVAWFVPAVKDEHRIPVDGRVVVTRTRDGGRHFETLVTGLPQHHAYDLTYRHALDVDAAGERLAFGSTTGSLWISEDQGDSWHAVSTHLPPVHAVQFVKQAF